MTHSIFFKTDYTYPEPVSGRTDPPYGRLVIDVKGMDDPDRFFKVYHIKPGIYLSVYNQRPADLPAMGFEVNNAPVSFSFIVSGTCHHRVRGKGFSKPTEFNLTAGTNAVACLQDITGDMNFKPGMPIICADLKIDRRLLYAYLEERPGPAVPGGGRIVRSGQAGLYRPPPMPGNGRHHNGTHQSPGLYRGDPRPFL